MLLPPPQAQIETPPMPPGFQGLRPVSTRVITVEGVRVAKVALWVDLPVLRRLLSPGAINGVEARRRLSEGRVRVVAVTTYLVDIGPQRRRKRLEAFFSTHWPQPMVDLSHRAALMRYLHMAAQPITMGEVQSRALEPGWGLWFQARGSKWMPFGDADLGAAWAKGELGDTQDQDYAKGLEEDLAAALRPQRAK